jgi:hypothetical protein
MSFSSSLPAGGQGRNEEEELFPACEYEEIAGDSGVNPLRI